MAHFSLENFKASVLGEGLAKTNRFEVRIIPPAGFDDAFTYSRKASLYCETASFPLLNVTTKQHRIYGPAYQRPVTSEYGGEGIPLTFHLDQKMDIKVYFDNWIQNVVNRNTYNVAYQDEYTGEIELYQLDSQENETYGIKLLEAFPRSINLLELNNSSQNQTHRLTVLFAYRKWELIL
jgi:hypothetical protein